MIVYRNTEQECFFFKNCKAAQVLQYGRSERSMCRIFEDKNNRIYYFFIVMLSYIISVTRNDF